VRTFAPVLAFLIFIFANPALRADSRRAEAEYYVRAYALHYAVPLQFVRALIQEESGWQPCAISTRGAAGLMQLMPETARIFGVRDRCDVRQNISAGVRYLAHFISVFHGDLRLVAAAYQAGERRIAARGLNYSNPEVIAYVRRIRQRLTPALEGSPMEQTKGEAPCR
jgi:soluble lytic murein transglycosylase-like protein